jgi:hypothetical protein
MGKLLFGLVWAFIVAVAGYDTYFAWRYWACFDFWEVNPLARWLGTEYGFEGVFGLKAAVIAFSALVAVVCYRYRGRFTTFLYTGIVGGLHLALSLYYLFGQMMLL